MQVRRGTYKTPTVLVHPRQYDLIPWEQAEHTYCAFRDSRVEAELMLVYQD